MDIVELYVIIDDFCNKFMPKYINLLKRKQLKRRNRSSMLTTSEMVLIILLFTQSGYKCFKWYYINEVMGQYRSYFSELPSYNRFIELMPGSMLILFRFLKYLMFRTRQQNNNIEYIDSTKIPVCHNKRTTSHKVFEGMANIGKSSMGWFFGFKLHFTCDINGNLTNLVVTNANVDDRTPVLELSKGFIGKLFGDKGYVDKKLGEQLSQLGITLLTQTKKNMKARSLPAHLIDVIYSKKRSLIESVINIFKSKLQLCHTRHRSWKNFMVHIVATLLGYQLLCNKPKLNFNDLNLLDLQFA
jgi:hypothetical protein